MTVTDMKAFCYCLINKLIFDEIKQILFVDPLDLFVNRLKYGAQSPKYEYTLRLSYSIY